MTPTTPTPHTIHASPAGLTITARPGLSGEWLVSFVKRGRVAKQLDRTAAWRSGGWDETRWSPIGSPLVPAAALLEVERWLRQQGAA